MPLGGGGTSTSTSVFNMVLNTVGASGFASALTSAQNGINGVVSSLNKAGQAAASGRVNSELQAAATEKMTTSILRAQASLDIFKTKMMEQSQTLRDNQEASENLQTTIAELTQRLMEQQQVFDNLDPTSRGYAGRLSQISDALANTKELLSGYQTELKDVNDAVEKGTQKEALYQAQLAAREARIKASTVAAEQTKAQLTGFESFLATLIQIYNTVDQVSRTFDRITLTVQRMERIWINFRDIVNSITGKGTPSAPGGASADTGQASLIEAAIAPELMLGQAVATTAQKFSLLGQAAATAIGQGFVDLVESAVSAVQDLAASIVDLGKQGVQAAGDAERFNISLKSMIAVQKIEKDQTLSVADAMAQSQQEAAGLYQWTIKLGILSPFFIDTAKTALQSAIAMGFTTSRAMELTQATFDWGAATGKTSDQVTSVVQMLGQMNSIGTFNGRILRQLAIGGITVGNIFNEMAKQTGKTVEQLKALEAQGEITADMGISAILAFMHKFDGDAKSQAATINGLLTSLQSMGTLFLQEFFGPMDQATGKITGLAGSIQKQLKGIVDYLQQDWVPEVLERLGNGLGGIADKAFAWGNNLVTQFASGMLAAIGSILSALTTISNYIAYWLQPGSPPKILPDIGKWGQSAINEFFKGFSEGDLSLFNGIGDTIEKHLRAVLITQPSDKIGVLNNIFGERQAVSQAIAELDKNGSLAEATFQRIFKAMGGATTETQNYIRTSVALEEQNKRVTAAQTALDDVTKKYNDLLKPVQDNIQAITDAQADLTAEQQKTMLELILKDPNATLAEKAQAKLQIDQLSAQEKQRALTAEAKKEVDTAQAKVDAETAKQTALQNTLKLQQDILGAEDSQVALMQEYYDLMKEIANASAAAGGGGGGGQPKPPVDVLGGPVKFPQGKVTLPKWITDLESEIKDAWAAIQKAFGAISKTLEPVQKAFDRLGDAIHALFLDFALYIPEIEIWASQLAAWTIQRFSKEMPGAIDHLTKAVQNLQGIWDKNHLLILEVAAFVWQEVFEFIMANVIAFTLLTDLVTNALNFDWVKSFQNVQAVIGGFFNFIKMIWDAISLIFAGAINTVAGYLWGFLSGDWEPMWRAAWQWISGITALIAIAWKLMTGAINTILAPFISGIITKFQNFGDTLYWNFWKFKYNLWLTWTGWQDDIKTAVETWQPELQKVWDGVWKGIKDKSTAEIIDALTQFGKWLTDTEAAVSNAIPNLVTLGESIIQGLITGAGNMAKSLIDAVVGPITDAIAAARALLGNPHSPSPVTRKLLGLPFGQGIAAGILDAAPAISSAVSGAIGSAMQVNMIGGPGMASAGYNYNNQQTTNFNYSPTYQGGAPATSDNFALMQAMVV